MACGRKAFLLDAASPHDDWDVAPIIMHFVTPEGMIKSYINYFIYAYNKDYYKNKMNSKKYTRRRTLNVYKD